MPSDDATPAWDQGAFEQGALFADPSQPQPGEVLGYRGPTACSAAGITYRQLDYWARTDLVTPTIRTATGSGSQRLYSFKDILVLKVVKRLLDAGVSLQNIRVAVEALRQRGVDDQPIEQVVLRPPLQHRRDRAFEHRRLDRVRAARLDREVVNGRAVLLRAQADRRLLQNAKAKILEHGPRVR